MKNTLFLFLVCLLCEASSLFGGLTCFPRRPLGCGTGEVSAWGYADYLYLWRKHRFIPPLVTTSPDGTPVNSAGVLGASTASILFGNEKITKNPCSGGRVALGIWLNRAKCLGFGGTYFNAGVEKKKFENASNIAGSPTLARPYFDVVADAQEALLVAFPSLFAGSIKVEVTNSISGADVYASHRIHNARCVGIDLFVGYTYSEIDDSVGISSNSTNILFIDPNFETQTLMNDHFDCHNQFQAALVGGTLQAYIKYFAFYGAAKFGFGNMCQTIDISGDTNTIIPLNAGVITPGGLLALPTNIERHRRHRFCVMQNYEIKGVYSPWRHLGLTLGYTFYWWNRILLAGDQIDLNLNTSQQRGNPLVGEASPLVDLKDGFFWIHGITAGIRVCF